MDNQTVVNLYGLDEDARDQMKRENPGATFVDAPTATAHAERVPRSRKSKSDR